MTGVFGRLALGLANFTTSTPSPGPAPSPTISNTPGGSTLAAGSVSGFAQRANAIAARSAAIDARLAALES